MLKAPTFVGEVNSPLKRKSFSLFSSCGLPLLTKVGFWDQLQGGCMGRGGTGRVAAGHPILNERPFTASAFPKAVRRLSTRTTVKAALRPAPLFDWTAVRNGALVTS